jgi:hypothetical protein
MILLLAQTALLLKAAPDYMRRCHEGMNHKYHQTLVIEIEKATGKTKGNGRTHIP